VSTGTQVEVVMPQMGVSVSEGTVTRWLKQPGDTVELDETLLEISTDKVDTEVPSPGAGVVAEIRVQEGETVEVGTVLAVIAPEGAATVEAPEAEPEAPAEDVPAEEVPVAPVAEAAPAPPTEVQATAEPAPPAPEPAGAPTGNGRTFVSPVVARIAAEHGVDPSAVAGTGQGGRVTKKDILAYIESGAASAAPAEETPAAAAAAPAAPEAPAAPQPEAPVPPQPEAPAAPAPAPAPASAPAPAAATAAAAAIPVGAEHEEPMNAMRRGIAEHMRRSLDTSAHVTSAIEVDMSRVVAARERLKKEYQASYGVNPTYLSFVTQAAIETLKDWPWINGEMRGEKIVTRSHVHVGMAVSLEDGKGLIVPVIRNAQDLNLLGIARAIAELAEKARTKKLLPDDVQGGTITVTNPGGYGTFHGTPIISQPQAAILGTYALVKRPWVVQDELGQDVIAIRPMMNITLTYDHRLIDGAYAGSFLRDLRERLENWSEG
jgi:pyruvate dehydrogenase E2 component (dihydrolipoamide acetyltransferase)